MNVRQCMIIYRSFWPFNNPPPLSFMWAHSSICQLYMILLHNLAFTSRTSAAQICEESKIPIWQPLTFLILSWYWYFPSPCYPLCWWFAVQNSTSPGKTPLADFLWPSFFCFLFFPSQISDFLETVVTCSSVFLLWTVRSMKTGAASLLYFQRPSWYLT